ncbi:MAG: DUF1232 domain-containing protein [Deltaproteobacteria bacterium]|nr:DUF1232 domain-containing protein [Deltaproteobacteria bacterium]
MTTPASSTPTAQRTETDWALLRQLPNFARLYWRLFRDQRVSRFPKALLVLTAVYIVMPFDLLPDYMPVIGQIDDLVLFLGACKAFMYLCPHDVVQEHVRQIDGGAGHPTDRCHP